ncbi:alpha/beta-hydrolase [Mytilinidion resinicola]|uniref:Alpha/beta-hydrolase n=1 Tax=Mytilinidion resinicola TaxID=574789 RepID=A0A6A6Y4B5_9PEZI|nr:alpha/beta-hydrolase [Mytilinidion resinicola]KAF2803632.1 alpha/beta-hydrolase [Mytilinidion resinicola]
MNSGPYLSNHLSTVHLATPPQKDSKWKSSLNVVKHPVHAASTSVNNLQGNLHSKSTVYLNQGAALCDLISSRFDAVITSIDGEIFSGDEKELSKKAVVYQQYPTDSSPPLEQSRGIHNVYPSAAANRGQVSGSNYFSKVWLYSNSRLPPHLPPLKVYMPTYPLLCLAAQFSENVYSRPTGSEREAHVEANWRQGTKAMVLKSLPIDDMNTVVFAIRGSQTFMDWAVNFRPEPSMATGFLDDPGNKCHSGFLHVARQMIVPVAARLRTLLSENPSRSASSLLITGHSAGGAVAALLYAHMLSETVTSELTYLTGFFKRVHCITFGAPPVSLLPLQKPPGKRHSKSLFFGFVNEGDPVCRADRNVVGSLLKLYATPAPGSNCSIGNSIGQVGNMKMATVSTIALTPNGLGKIGKRKEKQRPQPQLGGKSNSFSGPAPSWTIPEAFLSTAGRIVVLRVRPGSSDQEDVEAVTVNDQTLRQVVFGDPVCHMMKLYNKRIKILATRAVTGNMGSYGG